MKWWADLNPWVKGLVYYSFAGGAMSVQALNLDPVHFNMFTAEGLRHVAETFFSGAILALLLHIAPSPAKKPEPPKDEQ